MTDLAVVVCINLETVCGTLQCNLKYCHAADHKHGNIFSPYCNVFFLLDKGERSADGVPGLHQGTAESPPLPGQHGGAEGRGQSVDQSGHQKPSHRKHPFHYRLRGQSGSAKNLAR